MVFSPGQDLFGEPLLPHGLGYVPDLLSPDDESMLQNKLGSSSLSPFRFQGWEGKRLTASFGWQYDFENGNFAETSALPDWLLPLREQAARLAEVAAQDLVHALLIRYDPGAGIGWHRDRPVFEHVVGVSLGAPATLRLRRRHPEGFERRTLFLEPRSAYVLGGEARHEWEHSIAPIDATRWSITFRSLSARGWRLAKLAR